MRPKPQVDSIEDIMKREIADNQNTSTSEKNTNIISAQNPPQFTTASQINEKRTSFTIPGKEKTSENTNVLNTTTTKKIEVEHITESDTETDVEQGVPLKQKERVVKDTYSLDIDVEWS